MFKENKEVCIADLSLDLLLYSSLLGAKMSSLTLNIGDNCRIIRLGFEPV